MSEKGPKKVRAKAPAKKAAKPRKKAKEVEEEKHETPARPSRVELGEAPRPMVVSRHRFSTRSRQARGYSFGELQSAGVQRADVARLSIPLDIRRRTTLEQNVQSLKGWFAPMPKVDAEPAPEAAAEPASKPAAKRKKKSAK
jgi:ribosomal protein L13E